MPKFSNWEMRKMLEEVGLPTGLSTPDVQELAFECLMETRTHKQAVNRLFRILKRRGYDVARVSLNAKQ